MLENIISGHKKVLKLITNQGKWEINPYCDGDNIYIAKLQFQQYHFFG